MMKKFLYDLTACRPCRLIKRNDGTPYLERYYLGQLFGVTFYLHRFVDADGEEHLHNHPWTWSRSLVLTGRYLEEYVTDLCPRAGPSGCLTSKRWIRFWNVVNGNSFHRIAEVKPDTWTLFFHSKRARVRLGQASILKGWGFLEREYLIGHHETTVFKPHTSVLGAWWLDAPVGAEADREPL